MDSRYYHPELLASARQQLGKTQQEVADELAVDRQTVYRAEAGANVSYELLVKICSIYRIPMTSVVVPFPAIG